MNSKGRVIPIEELEQLVKKVDEYSERYDIPEEVYQSLLEEQEAYYEFLQNNPDCYQTRDQWEEAGVKNRFIVLLLMTRISEIMESKYNEE